MKYVALVALALYLTISAASAVTIIGLAKSSCGSWTQEKQRDSVKYWQMEAWAMGFLSGWASAWADAQPKIVNPLAGLDKAALAQWISNYCVAHPLDKLADAAYALTGELEKRQKSN